MRLNAGMNKDSHWKKQPKDGASLRLNSTTQPLGSFKVFNQTRLLTKSWYPICQSSALKTEGRPLSKTVGSQRVTVFRGRSKKLFAVDSFCPHFGADLGNGQVKNDNIQCYFHNWQFSGDKGELSSIPGESKLPNCPRLTTYPVTEKFGFVWVYSEKSNAVSPTELPWEGLSGHPFFQTTLFVHHHALMMSAIDLHHFFSVHNLPIDFKYQTKEIGADHFHWSINGNIPKQNLLQKFGRLLLGENFTYNVDFLGGNIVSIRYGANSNWFGRKNNWALPHVQILWASTPLKSGVSETRAFILYPKVTGFLKKIRKIFYTVFSIAVLYLLKDDDIKAFPHMKFNPKIFIAKDRASLDFIKQIEELEVSEWSFEN